MDSDWDDLKIFTATCQAGSFSRAAALLGVGQATVSRRIAALEARLGHALFDRSQTGLTPTAAAGMLRPYAEAMEVTARQAKAALQGLEMAPEGRVRVAVPPGLAVDLFPLILPQLRRRYPKLCVDLLSDNFNRNIDRHEADVAIRLARPDAGDLLVRQILEPDAGLFASQGYVDSLPKRPRLKHLEFITWSEELAHLPMAQWIQAHAEQPPVFTTNSFLAMRTAATQGLGVVLLVDIQAQLAGLVRVPVRVDNLPKLPTYLVVHRALRHVPRVAAIVDVLVEAFAAVRQGPEVLRSRYPGQSPPARWGHAAEAARRKRS